MNTPVKNLFLAACVVSALLLGLISWQQSNRLRALEGAAAQTTADRDAARSRASDIEQRLASAEANVASLEAKLRNPSTGSIPTPIPANSRPQAEPSFGMPTLDNQDMQQVMANSIRNALDQRYGALFRRLNLSSSELEQLKDLLLERQLSGMDVLRVAREQGLNPATHAEELNTLIASAHDDIDVSIQALLGSQGFQQFQQFNQNVGAFTALDQIEGRLVSAGAPLQETQSDALLRILMEQSQSSPMPGGGPSSGGFIQTFNGNRVLVGGMMTQPRITDEIVAAARNILSPAQIEALVQLQTEQANQPASVPSMGGAIAQPMGPQLTPMPQTAPLPLPHPAPTPLPLSGPAPPAQ